MGKPLMEGVQATATKKSQPHIMSQNQIEETLFTQKVFVSAPFHLSFFKPLNSDPIKQLINIF